MKRTTLLAIPAFLALSSAASAATVTYNAAFVSNYLFRGLSQTDDGPALQGGADVKNGNAYAGAWFSNVDKPDGAEGLPVEMDVYFGYNNQFDGFNLDMGVRTDNTLFDVGREETEFKLGTSPAKGLSVNMHRGVKDQYWYPEVTFEKHLPQRLYLDVAVGMWMVDDADDKALTARVEVARDFPEFHKIDLFIAADFISDDTPYGDNNDKDDSDLNFVIGVRKNF